MDPFAGGPIKMNTC